MKKTLIIFVLLCATCLIVCANTPNRNTPANAMNGFLECLKKGDYEKVMDYVHTSVQPHLVRYGFERAELNNERIIGYKITKVTITEDGNFAVVLVALNLSNGKKEINKFELKKFSNGWKVIPD